MSSDDSDSDSQFIRRFIVIQNDLRTFIVGMTPSRADADDILQEVNLALWHKRDRYDPAQDFLHWAIGFAMLEIRSFRGKSARSRLWFNDAVLESLAASWPTNLSASDERRDALLSCLQKLGSVERQYIVKYYGKQLTGQDLAQSSGRPLSTVYKVLTRARNRLRECVEHSLAQADHGKAMMLWLAFFLPTRW